MKDENKTWLSEEQAMNELYSQTDTYTDRQRKYFRDKVRAGDYPLEYSVIGRSFQVTKESILAYKQSVSVNKQTA